MPGGMNGLEATQAILAESTGKPIKVVGVTSFESDEGIQRCYDSGMVAVVTKPIDGNRLQTAFSENY